ncbi:transcriptional regulator [Roseofilum sp. BLCC_M143]|uniref:Transcriptional regulator n=2 Tax=Roseofilum TaxID=1233426 RepID=A0ABT7BZ92_9CYAN|nr:transcriptional regulator [Roseofilum casamattae BLCC-M143]
MLKRDRFELLSAYLDGEVSASESKQVEEWLENDPTVQCLYQRLLTLRRGFEMMPAPVQDRPVDEMVTCVMNRLEQRPRRKVIWLGAGAAAAAAIAAISSMVSSPGQLFPQFAESNTEREGTALMRIALDEPLISFPKTDASPLGLPNATGDLQEQLQNRP